MIKQTTFEYARRGDTPLLMDVHHPGQDNPPLILFGYGGGFTKGSRTSTAHDLLVHGLTKAGFAVAIPDYRLNTGPQDISAAAHQQVTRLAKRVKRQGWQLKPRLYNIGLFTACEDISDAMRFCQANAARVGVSADNPMMLGISAGGLAGNTLCYPPGVWRGQFAQPAAMVSLAAPVVYGWRIAPNGPPTWVIHGKRDRILPSEDSLATRHLAQAVGANVTVTIPPKAPHIGIDRFVTTTKTDNGNSYFDDIIRFFKTHTMESSATQSAIG